MVREIREVFNRRADKLQERRTFPPDHTTVERFARGAAHGLRKLRIQRGVRREATFYPEARLDGLLKRVEELGVSMHEQYVGKGRVRKEGVLLRWVVFVALRWQSKELLLHGKGNCSAAWW